MRLPYVDKHPSFENADDQAILERVLKRRGERGLIPLDQALLNSPPVADGWNTFLGNIRSKTMLSQSIKEAAICRVAVLNSAWFEWDAHAPLLQAANELRPSALLHIIDAPLHQIDANVPANSGLDEKHLAVLAYTDAMTRDIRVKDEIFERLKKAFEGENQTREVTEVTATVACYNCVSRFLVALDVGEKNEQGGPSKKIVAE